MADSISTRIFALTFKQRMSKFYTYSEKCLLDFLKKGEFAAFEEIYHRYWKRLYYASYRRVQSREISEELIQDIFTSLWEKRESLAIEDLSSYLLAAVKYKVINHFHRELSRKVYLETQTVPDKDVINSTEEMVLHEDLNQALNREIEKLPAKRQKIFRLYRQENLSMKQVASELGISEKTVENQLNRAFKVLKLSLKHFL